MSLSPTPSNDVISTDWFCDKRLTDGQAVIVGTVVKVDSAEKAPRASRAKFDELEGYTISDMLQIRVDKIYRYDFARDPYWPTTITIFNLESRDLPAKPIKVGEKWLFYLDALTVLKGDLVSFYVDPLSQTKPISEATDSITFLERVCKLSVLRDVLGYEGTDSLIGGIINGKAVFLPKPAYPDEAKKEKWSERVQVAVLVDETGQVIKAKALCSLYESFGKAAERAALKAKFSPILVSGKPIKVQGFITYNFVP